MSAESFCETEEWPVKRDEPSDEDLGDAYPRRRRFFHVTQAKAGLTMFGSVLAALTVFGFIADAHLDNRMLAERDWVGLHFVTRDQEDERVRQLDRRLQEIRETQIQIATMLDEMKKQIFDGNRIRR